MNSHELMRDLFTSTNVKQLASELGVSQSLVYKRAEDASENGSGAVNPLDRVEALLKYSRDSRIIQWLCASVGGFFVGNPKRVTGEFIMPIATNSAIKDLSSLIGTIAAGAEDNKITPKEAELIRHEWEQVKSTLEGFVQNCEDGKFAAKR